MTNRYHQNKNPINRQIRASRVRVILEGSNEIMSIEDALALAARYEMDLVQFNHDECPTCRILNYSKYKYQEKKKKKQENAVKIKIKEIQFRPSIDQNDLKVKTNHVTEFLQKGNEVRLRMKLRGREKVNSEKHGLLLLEIANRFESLAKIEYKLDQNGIPIGGLVTLKPTRINPTVKNEMD